MNCKKCRKPITAIQRRDAKTVFDANGRVDGVYHRKCHYVHLRETSPRFGKDTKGRYLPDSPDAYEMELLRKRQAEIAEQSKLEERPSRWDDHHDPDTMEI